MNILGEEEEGGTSLKKIRQNRQERRKFLKITKKKFIVKRDSKITKKGYVTSLIVRPREFKTSVVMFDLRPVSSTATVFRSGTYCRTLRRFCRQRDIFRRCTQYDYEAVPVQCTQRRNGSAVLSFVVTVPDVYEQLYRSPQVYLCVRNARANVASYFLSRVTLANIRAEDFTNGYINSVIRTCYIIYRNAVKQCLVGILEPNTIDSFVDSLGLNSVFTVSYTDPNWITV